MKLYGYTLPDSSNNHVVFVAAKQDHLLAIVGKMLYFDTVIEGETYRSFGTVTHIITQNQTFNPSLEGVVAAGKFTAITSDQRKATFDIQAVFRKNEDGWEQYGASLPTSPDSSEQIQLVDESTITEMSKDLILPSIGTFRAEDIPLPINTLDFGGNRGAYHSAVIGKSGSGKALALDTPIPTPRGWTTMGELQAGDTIFDEAGNPTTVVKLHEIITDADCYEVSFNDASRIVADSRHLWQVIVAEADTGISTPRISGERISHLRRLAVDEAERVGSIVSLTSLAPEILNTPLYTHFEGLGEFMLGAALDTVANDLSRQLVSYASSTDAFTFDTPHVYVSRVLTTFEIKNLLDKGALVFVPTNKPVSYVGQPNPQNLDVVLQAHTDDSLLTFKPSDYGLTLEEGYEYVSSQGFTGYSVNGTTIEAVRSTFKAITSIARTATVPVRCITVDSPSSLFLAGEGFIPTHNTAMYGFTLATYMRHEEHALIVIDPQGQWSNEKGFIFSPQAFAKGLGREVKIIRIAEDTRLPLYPELFAELLAQTKAWTRMRRMGKENEEVFSREVSELLARENVDEDPRTILTKVFSRIAKSVSIMRRIYADDKARDSFKDALLMLTGEFWEIQAEKDAEEASRKKGRNPEPEFLGGIEDEPIGPTEDELEDIESQWDSILKAFTPLLNLFSSTNLEGGKRIPLDGGGGILTDIFKVRNENSNPAPYVIVDMSPNIRVHQAASLDKGNVELEQAKLLDKDSVKALILQVLFQEIKKAAEYAFSSSGGGNLNTQIIFDEAWRYAPEAKTSPAIDDLSDMLEGFAFDTRKFGIGWTYILQSPSDLKKGIWKQLTYIYALYGLVGGDLKMLEERYSDLSQTAIYKGFISPASTNVYPLMIIGSVSPLIFTNSPTFTNVFTTAEAFIEANKLWVNNITSKRGLGRLTVERVSQSPQAHKKPTKKREATYRVGKNYDYVQPQIETATPTPEKPKDEFDAPF